MWFPASVRALGSIILMLIWWILWFILAIICIVTIFGIIVLFESKDIFKDVNRWLLDWGK